MNDNSESLLGPPEDNDKPGAGEEIAAKADAILEKLQETITPVDDKEHEADHLSDEDGKVNVVEEEHEHLNKHKMVSMPTAVKTSKLSDNIKSASAASTPLMAPMPNALHNKSNDKKEEMKYSDYIK